MIAIDLNSQGAIFLGFEANPFQGILHAGFTRPILSNYY